MAHSDCGWTCGCAGKTVKSLKNTCHTRALLRWRFTTKRRYIKCMHLYLTALWENAESRLKAPFISILARYNVRDSQPSLAASPGVHIIPGRRAGLPSSSRYGAAIPETSHTRRRRSSSTDPPFGRYQSSDPAVGQTLHCRQPSFSGCRFLHLEHTRRKTSSVHQLWSHFSITW